MRNVDRRMHEFLMSFNKMAGFLCGEHGPRKPPSSGQLSKEYTIGRITPNVHWSGSRAERTNPC